MSKLTALRRYALKTDEELSKEPPSVLFTKTDKTVTIFDLFPKSNSFHFLLLPRITVGNNSLPQNSVSSLKSLLGWDKEKAQQVIETIASDAKVVENMIGDEMTNRFGFSIYGVRCYPTELNTTNATNNRHLHLHIIASDLFSASMKTKKHYNSFHPKSGFFLALDDVLSWFTSTPSYYDSMVKLSASKYEPLLKEDLVCWKCDEPFSTIPKLKEHLKKEWEQEASRAKSKLKAKSKTNSAFLKRKAGSESTEDTERASKRAACR